MNIPLNISPLGYSRPELPAGYTRLAFLEPAQDNNLSYIQPFLGLTSKPARPWVRAQVAFGAIVETYADQGYAMLLYRTYPNFQGGITVLASGIAQLYYSVPSWTKYTASAAISGYNKTKYSWNAAEGFVINNEVLGPQQDADITDGWQTIRLVFFTMTANYGGKCRPCIYEFETGYEDATLYACVPCVTPTGKTCFYNKITATDINAGAVLAGIETLKQLQQLATNLPSVTGSPEIKLSLPGEWNGDASANAQLSIISGKGWRATITYRDVKTSTSSSFVLGNRGDGGSSLVLWCRAVESEYGNYQDADGVRYYVETCHDIWHPQELSPDDLGYTAVLTLEDYLTERGLTAVVYEEDENFTTN